MISSPVVCFAKVHKKTEHLILKPFHFTNALFIPLQLNIPENGSDNNL